MPLLQQAVERYTQPLMDTFLKLNRQKLKPAFFRTSLVTSGLVLLIFLIAFLVAGNLPSGKLLLSILLFTGIGFPLFTMFLGYLTGLLNHKARQNAFSKTPFDQISNIGFYKAYIGENSKWSFTDEIKEGKLNGFTLRMDMCKEKGRHFIEFEIPVEWKKLDKSEFNRLTERFKQHNAEFRIGSIVKQYDTRQHTLQTVSDLKQDLELFTALLHQEGFKAKS
ncbi:hypothetical protein [Paracnuella aquatica]|uniref:hypothetical protein n=1 Tax=Paracnuella aquatica TaxID=2268757 RepID=UPI000DEF6858|nr:hypothetical protein [Paracnuella aquatica]RPD43430.1 hypothetical protein DRJ53_20195 [Paracnuella aquatica]